jgi:lipopolysaccharide export system protein LptA
MNLLRLLLVALATATAALAQNAEPIPTTVESDGEGVMVSTDTETTITFEKNVRVRGTNILLTCDYLQVVVLRKGDPKATIGKVDKFRSLLARGNVRIVQGDREAVCGRAEVLPEQDKIILSENPVVVFHDQTGDKDQGRITGKTITMHRGNRMVEIDAPVATLQELKDLGFDEKKLLNPEKDSAPKQDQPPAKRP